MAIRPDDAAFPRPSSNYDGVDLMDQQGMSLRDWFAGMALCGAHDAFAQQDTYYIAQRAYEIADEMLAQGRRPRTYPVSVP